MRGRSSVPSRAWLVAVGLVFLSALTFALWAPRRAPAASSASFTPGAASADSAGAAARVAAPTPPSGLRVSAAPLPVSADEQAQQNPENRGRDAEGTRPRPHLPGNRLIEAELLSPHEDLAVDPVPPLQGPIESKLRWLENILLDGVSREESPHLVNRFLVEPDPAFRAHLVAAASEAALDDMRVNQLVELGLGETQAPDVRIQALYVARDRQPELVRKALRDSDETVRLLAEALLDPGMKGSAILQ